jgi:hypothetical protein
MQRHSAAAQESSFKEFISRPENKPLIEAHQQQEVQELVTLSERLQLQEASSKVRSDRIAVVVCCLTRLPPSKGRRHHLSSECAAQT